MYVCMYCIYLFTLILLKSKSSPCSPRQNLFDLISESSNSNIVKIIQIKNVLKRQTDRQIDMDIKSVFSFKNLV